MDTAKQVREQIDMTERSMRALKRKGRTVIVIWDFDFVLADGRSHDVYEAVDRDVTKYHAHEERLLLQVMREGPWAETARKKGDLYDRCCIATARSGVSALRVQLFCEAHGIPAEDMYYIGSASKRCTYELILKRYKPDPKAWVYLVEDSSRHIETFGRAVRDLGMASRTRAILTPQLRDYTLEDHHERTQQILRDTDEPFLLEDDTLVDPGARKRFMAAVAREAHELRTDLSRKMNS